MSDLDVGGLGVVECRLFGAFPVIDDRAVNWRSGNIIYARRQILELERIVGRNEFKSTGVSEPLPMVGGSKRWSVIDCGIVSAEEDVCLNRDKLHAIVGLKRTWA